MSNLKMADWIQAQLHARALTPGVAKSNEGCRVCKCCNLQIDKDDIAMCENIKQLAILGPGFPLYFIFLKYSIIMIFLLLMSYSILTIYWSYSYNYNFCFKDEIRIGKDDQKIHCTSWMILLSRLEFDIDVNQNILRVTSFVTQLFFLIYVREQLRKHSAYFHQRQQPKISDYSIMIKNIPKQNQIKKKIQILFQRCFFEKYKIECIRPIAYLDHYETNFNQIQKEYKSYLRLIAKVERSAQDQLQIKRTEQYINKLKIQDRKRQDKYAQSIERDEAICEKAIVIFNTEKQKQQILKEQLDMRYLRQIFGDEADKVEMVSAPEPNQIIISNINLPKSTKIKRIILGWILFAILLSAVTGVFYLLLTFKSQQIIKSLYFYKSDPIAASNLKSYALALVITSIVLIVLFNKLLLANILHKITDLERHKTASAFELSFSIKYALGLVFTTAILTLLVENIKFNNIYQHDFGVIEEQTIMYFFSAFFVPFIWFVNPWFLWKKAQMFIFRGSLLLTQSQANNIMELPEYNIGKRYAEIIEMVWFTYFYASLIPIGALLTLIGASIFYWVDKYNLLRKSSVKQTISDDFSMKALIMLDLTLVLKPVGELVFDMQIREEFNIQSLILILVGAAYVLIPKDRLLDWINGQKFQLNRLSYKQVRSNSLFQMYSKLNHQRIGFKDQIQCNEASQIIKNKIEEKMRDLDSCHILSIHQLQVPTHRKDQCPEEMT